MITLKLSLDKRRQRTDGSTPIVFRLYFNGETRDISTGFTCKYLDWNTKTNGLKTETTAQTLLYERLQEQRLKYMERILDFERNHISSSSTVQDVKNYVSGKTKAASTILEFWEEEITRLTASRKHGNARNYKSVLQGVSCEIDLNRPFSSITYKWLVDLETKLLSKGLNANSVAVYMRTLRALYNKAVNQGLIDESSYPFRRYKIKGAPTSPRVITIEELQQFFSYKPEVKAGSYGHHYWNYARLIFLLRGINFTDLALLTRENIKNGRIIYSRSKTKKTYSVKLEPLAKDIIEAYIHPERITLLPILNNEQYKDKKNIPDTLGWKRKYCNKGLKKIGKKIGFKEPLSTYVFRYSHANACKKMGYPKDMISESLGHAYGMSVSSCYLEDYDLELIDEMNKNVCNLVIDEGT